MDIENKLTQINTFTGGMNTDLSDSLLKSEQYRLAANLRIVTSEDGNTGELHQILGAYDVDNEALFEFGNEVLGATQIRDLGVIIVKNDDAWSVIKFKCQDKLPEVITTSELLTYQHVFGPCEEMLADNKLSLVTRYEDEDNIKLYIADGEHPILIVNLAKDYGNNTDINQIISYPKAIFKKPIFCGLTSGSLKAGVVEYSYLFYNDGGNYSEISPSTKLISIHKGGASNAEGYPKDTTTNRGVSLKFDLSDNDSFDSLRIYRILYTEAGQLPTIEVIYENKLPETQTFLFVDSGQNAITTLTLEEYNSATGIHIIPRTIESKDDYMFASNIKTDARLDTYTAIRDWDSRAFLAKADGDYDIINRYGRTQTIRHGNGDWILPLPDLDDDCINPDPNTYLYSYGQNATETYFGGNGPNVSWRFVRTSLDGDSTSAGVDLTYGHHGSAADSISYAASDNKFDSSNINARYITLADTASPSQQPREITIDLSDSVETDGEETRNYGNEKVTYSLKSLHRGETYRYGIVLYSDKGETTGVKWIADIKVPEMHTKNFNTFLSHKNGIELEVYPLGIEFSVDISSIIEDPEIIEDNVHIVGYEIVRCPRTEADIKTISLGVLARPCAKFIDPGSQSSLKIYPLTPTGWLTTCGYWAGGYLLTNYSPYDISEQEDVNNILGWLMTNNYFNPSELSYESGSSSAETKIPGTATFMYGNPSRSWTSIGSLSCTFVEDATKLADEEFDSANIAFYRPTEAIDLSGKTVYVYNTDSGCVMKANNGLSYTGVVINTQTGNTVKAKIDNNSAFRFVFGDHFFSFSTFGSDARLESQSTFIANNSSSELTSGYFGNYSVYQFVSPEVSYLRQSMRDLIVDNVNVSPQMFLFGTTCDSDGSFADRLTNTAWTITGGDGSKDNHIYKMPNPMGVNPGGGDYDGGPDWDHPADGLAEKNGTPPNPNMVKGLFMYPGNTYTKIPLNGSYGQPGRNYNQGNGRLSPMINKEVVCRQACMYNYMTTYTYYENGTGGFSNTTDAGKRSGFYDNVQKGKFSQAHLYIKLYELTDKVVRNNLQNATSFTNPFNKVAYRTSNGFISLGSTVTGEQEVDIDHSDITVSRVAFPDTLGWDDFNDATSDANQNFRVTYSDKTTPIGTDSYNNWVSSGMWGIGFNEITPSKANMSYAKKDIIDRYYGGMGGVNGPAGSCVLLKLDVNSHNQISNTTGAHVIYESFGHGDPQYKLCNIKYNDPDLGRGLIANVDNIPGTSKYIYRESALGTYLVNITRNVTPYGGADFAHRQSSTYNSYGDYFEFGNNQTSTSYVFDGDCFIQPFEYTSLHKMASALKYAYSVRTANITYAIPVETNINIVYEHGYAFSKHGSNPLIQEQPSDVNGQFIQDTPQYVYNGVYSTNTSSKTFAAEEDYDRISSQLNFDYRTYHSNPKMNNEALDSWIKYMPANHLDVDTRFGPITGLRTFGNKLIYWQSGATGMFSVNERTQITDNNNLPLILGTGGVLTRYDYISLQNGMHIDQYADTQSNAALYWFDYDKHELCVLAHDGSILVLSKAKGVQNYLNKLADNDNLTKRPCLVYDTKFNEVISCVGTDNLNIDYDEDNLHILPKSVSLVYNENQQAFTGIYTIPVVERCVFTNNLYMVGTVYQDIDNFSYVLLWNKIDGRLAHRYATFKYDDAYKYLRPYLKHVVNESPITTKTFDTFKFGGRVYGGNNSDNSISQRPPFSLDTDNNDGLSDLNFIFSTPLKQRGSINGKSLENIEYDFRGYIPRNGEDPNNNVLFGDRLRGKTMQCEMYSKSSDYDFSLQYIATKYRVSWT